MPDGILTSSFMINLMLAWIGMPEALLIMVVMLVFFGAKKLPELAKGLGQGIKEFKKATNEVTEDFNRSLNAPPETPATPAPKQVPESTEPADTAGKAKQ